VIPAGRLEFRARPPSQADLLAKRLSLWVEIWVDEHLVRTVPVGFELSAFGPAYVAGRSQSAGEILEPSNLEVREVEWSGRDLLPVESSTRQALRLRRPLEAGAVLTRAHVEPAPALTQGAWATLHVRQGLVDLEGRVEVLQDGRTGQMVRVKLPGASASILARVTGPESVEVLQ
jgi:flagellar basal body P-ring formation protein FlgA